MTNAGQTSGTSKSANDETMKQSSITTDLSLPAKLFRFAGVGAVTGLIYVIVVALLVETFDFAAKWSSAIGYLAALPANFLAHKKVTFRSKKPHFGELIRFIVLHFTNLMISIGGMFFVVDWLEYSYWIGSFLVLALVPISTFIIMDLWVFADSSDQNEARQQP